MYLQLVLTGLVLRARVEKVDGENLQRWYCQWVCPDVSHLHLVCVSLGGDSSAVAEFCCRVLSQILLLCTRPGVGGRCDVPYWRLPDINWRDRLRRRSIFDGCRRWTGLVQFVREAFALRRSDRQTEFVVATGLCFLPRFFPSGRGWMVRPQATRHSLSLSLG